MDFTIDAEFESLCPKLMDEEYELLEQSLIIEGCRDALVIWDSLLLDGHNRYAICEKHDIPFETQSIDLPDRLAAIKWVIDNQLGRRNLTPEQASYLRGKRYQAEKVQGKRTDLTSGKIYPKSRTSESQATKAGVSEKTIRNDAQFAEAVDTVSNRLGLGAKQAILQGKVKTGDGKKATRSEVIIGAELLSDSDVTVTESKPTDSEPDTDLQEPVKTTPINEVAELTEDGHVVFNREKLAKVIAETKKNPGPRGEWARVIHLIAQFRVRYDLNEFIEMGIRTELDLSGIYDGLAFFGQLEKLINEQGGIDESQLFGKRESLRV